MKDLLDNNGNLSQEHILKKLASKSNWISEYMTIKSAFGKLLEETNTSMSNYIQRNLLERLTLMTKSKTYSLQEGICSSKLFYKTLVEKKYEKPLSERKWENYLGISLNNLDWQNIYVTSLKSLEYKKFCEFKFKVLHNILPCGKLVSK